MLDAIETWLFLLQIETMVDFEKMVDGPVDEPVVYNWSKEGCGMCCCVCGKVHIKDHFLPIGKSSLCGNSRFPQNKYVTITI